MTAVAVGSFHTSSVPSVSFCWLYRVAAWRLSCMAPPTSKLPVTGTMPTTVFTLKPNSIPTPAVKPPPLVQTSHWPASRL